MLVDSATGEKDFKATISSCSRPMIRSTICCKAGESSPLFGGGGAATALILHSSNNPIPKRRTGPLLLIRIRTKLSSASKPKGTSRRWMRQPPTQILWIMPHDLVTSTLMTNCHKRKEIWSILA